MLTMKKDIKSELSGDFRDTVVALFLDPVTYDCYSLNNALKGLHTNKDTLIEILGIRPNYYINNTNRNIKMKTVFLVRLQKPSYS